MAGPNLLTKDDVPLRDIGTDIFEMLEVFNSEASQGFIDMVSSEVNSRTFMARTGDFSWDEVAELEHAKTASIDDYQLAFGVDMYAKSLGMSREFVEDSPAEYIREHVAEVVAAGQDRMFDVMFDTMRNGIADGSTLWYDPEDYGAYSFSQTHNHTYTGLQNEAADATRVLFDDSNTHTPTEMVRELSNELTHHGYTPDMALVPSGLADWFIRERSDGHGTNYYAPQAERLENTQFNDGSRIPIQPNGVTIMQTAYLQPDGNGHYPIYMYDSSQNPVKRNTVRPMELTDNTGAPVGGAGGFQGDPGALLGAYASMRFGTIFDDPLAGVTIDAVDPADLSVS